MRPEWDGPNQGQQPPRRSIGLSFLQLIPDQGVITLCIQYRRIRGGGMHGISLSFEFQSLFADYALSITAADD